MNWNDNISKAKIKNEVIRTEGKYYKKKLQC